MTRIEINHITINLPSSLSEVTLGQWITYYNDNGRLLDEMLKSIMEIKDETEKEIELSEFSLEKMFRTFSFFSGVSVEVLKSSDFVDSIAEIYLSTLAPLFDHSVATPVREFTWKDQKWVLPPTELKQGSEMTFGEFIDAKQRMQDMQEENLSNTDKLLPLCAIFLRKQGEAYREEFLYEGSERLALMEQLPMDIAIQVAFFLKFSAPTFMSIFQYSGQQKPRVVASSPRSTSKNGVGSIFLKLWQKLKCSMFQPAAIILWTAPGWPRVSMYSFMLVKTKNSQKRNSSTTRRKNQKVKYETH